MTEAEFREQAKKDGIKGYCVGLALLDMGELLLVKRVQNDFLGGYWELPGGGVEDGESFELCLRREIREEIAVADFTLGGQLPHFDYVSSLGNRHRQWNVWATLVGSRSQIRLNPGEHDEAPLGALGYVHRAASDS